MARIVTAVGFAVVLPVSQSAQGTRDPLASENVGLGKISTVLLVLAPDCQACIDSMPFYRTLLALPKMDGVERRLVVLAQKGVIPVDRMLRAHRFEPHKLTSGPAATHDVTDVPTVIVLDAKGVRLGAWAGRLTAGQEKAVVDAVIK
jgi:hypothetical protein